jgi:DNA end-binding protein Ku
MRRAQTGYRLRVARAIWTGYLSFGLVNVPVGLYSATEDHTVHFRQFQEGTSSRIRYKRVNEDTGDEVAYDDIVKGADLGDGRYVILTQEELEQVEPGRSRTIEIDDFVDVADIDPIYYQKTYYLAPQDDNAQKAYQLLLEAMGKAGRVGVATFVMRGKQYLAAIRPQNDVLTLETMFFADEVRDPAKEIDQLPAKQRVSKRDLDMAVSLIKSMTTEWDPTNYRDTYRERVEQLIEAKRNDEEIVTEHEDVPQGEVSDLLEALRASVEQARDRRGSGRKKEPRKLQTRKSGESDEKPTKKASASRKVGSPTELEKLSKEELYDLAQQLEIAGRSKMSRKELAAAVAKAEKKAS